MRNLLGRVAAQEEALLQVRFLAPRSGRGDVRTRICGLVHSFRPQPANFLGWGIFQPIDSRRARLVEEAGLAQVSAYLQLLKPIRLRLVRQLAPRCWLAYPGNESDARQRLGRACPMPVHLVEEAAQFDMVSARFDGSTCWFEELDRRADPALADQLRTAHCPPGELVLKGLTPEDRTAYALAAAPAAEKTLPDEERLARALRAGGGQLSRFQDRGDLFVVEWTDSTGQHHSSSIRKADLTVLSAGVCLSGQDADFDLHSLVGVVEGFEY